jgi:hypothetical protein
MFLFIGVGQLVLVKQVTYLPYYFDTRTTRVTKDGPLTRQNSASELPQKVREFYFDEAF